LDYASLRKSIPGEWYQAIQNLDSFQESRETTIVTSLKRTNGICKWAYEVLIKGLKVKQPYKAKWSLALPNITEGEWNHYHTLPFKCTKNTKLQSFQYKIVHNILTTQKTLKVCKIAENDTCAYCGQDVETIQHLLFSCPYTRRSWNDLVDWLMPVLDISDLISEKYILLGSFSSDIINLLILITKYSFYVAKFRGERPNINAVKRTIMQEYLIERSIAKKEDRLLTKFNARWGNVAQLFGENDD